MTVFYVFFKYLPVDNNLDDSVPNLEKKKKKFKHAPVQRKNVVWNNKIGT